MRLPLPALYAARPADDGSEHDTLRSQTMVGLLLFVLVGIVVVLVFGQHTGAGQRTSATAIGLILAGAALVVGGLLGFLFGIPRTQQEGSGSTLQLAYKANTNLEQISDWLTKILVGFGLAQMQQIRQGFAELTAALTPGLGGTPEAGPFVQCAVVYFCGCGFLYGYFWTRWFFAAALAEADQDVVGKQVARAIEDTNAADARALHLVSRHLSTDSPPVPDRELAAAVRKASAPVRANILNQTQLQRTESWRARKPAMERTIAVFRALISAEPEPSHRVYAQLGYALKDKEEPDWSGAESALTKAIALRDAAGDEGWAYYDINRAVCRIALGEDDGLVLQDLQEAFRRDIPHPVVDDIAPIGEWMQRKHLTEAAVMGGTASEPGTTARPSRRGRDT